MNLRLLITFFVLFFTQYCFAQTYQIQQKIKAKFRFENNLTDASENKILVNAPLPLQFGEGILGAALHFKNDGERVEIPHRISTLDTTDKAISFWFYTDTLLYNYNNLLDKTAGSDYSIGIEKSTKNLQFTIHTKTKYTVFDFPIEFKKWYFVVVSKNKSGIKWYVNAEEKGFTPIVQNLSKPYPLIVGGGGSPYQHGYGFNGKIDELTFYFNELTQNEINILYEGKDVEQIVKNTVFQLGNVLFERDKSDLLPESYPSLNKILVYLVKNPKAKLEIIGHTDNKGSEKHNLKLSSERAENVKNYYIENGIKKKRIKAKGKGGKEPIDSNKTEEGMIKNRRVEFLIIE